MKTNQTLMRRVTDAFSAFRKVHLAMASVMLAGLLTLSTVSMAQEGPVTTLVSRAKCPGDTVWLAVNVQNLVNSAGYALSFSFDTSVLAPVLCTYGTPPNQTERICYWKNPALTGFFDVNVPNDNPTKVFSAYFTLGTLMNFSNATLFKVCFLVKSNGGYSPLLWDLTVDPGTGQYPYCNYADNSLYPEMIENTVWINGDIHSRPAISSQPFDLTLLPNTNGTFTLTGVDATAYQWQVSTDGGTVFTDIAAGNPNYSGQTTHELTIINATLEMNQYIYRCIVSGDCPSKLSITSDEVILYVTLIAPTAFDITPYGAANYCPGGTGIQIGLVNSEPDVFYQLYRDNNPVVGINIQGTGGPINLGPPQTIAGNYSAKGTNSGGTTDMNGEAVVGIYSLATASIVSGGTPVSGSSICSGQNISFFVNITLPNGGPFTVTFFNGNDYVTKTGLTAGVNQVQFTPPAVNPFPTPTVYTYTIFSVTDVHGCVQTNPASLTGNYTITVNSAPTPVAGSNTPVCVDETLTLTVNAPGATSFLWSHLPTAWTSTEQSPSRTPVLADYAGTYKIKVSANGCSDSTTTVVFVHPPRPAQPGVITGPASLCKGQTGVVYSIPAAIPGATLVWSVPSGFDIAGGQGSTSLTVNISANAINGLVSVAGTNDCGMGQARTLSVVVNDPPVMTWTNSLTPQCITSTTYLLSGASPAGGVYSGPGVSGTNFNASLAGLGTHTITYSYTDGNNCSGSITKNIVVNALPVVAWTGTLTGQCITATNYTLSGATPPGGNYSGPGVDGTNFSAAAAGLGNHTITYTYTDPITGCTNTAVNSITVNDLPNTSWPTALTAQCINSSEYTLNGGTPIGGVYSGPGVTGANFNASSAGAGLIILQYTYTDGNGCVKSATNTIQVNTLPVADAGADKYILYGEAAILDGGPGGAEYSYSWTPAYLLDNPAAQSPTTFPLTETTQFTLVVTNTATTCQQADDVIVHVNNPALSVEISVEPTYPLCAGAMIQLQANAQGGTGNYSYEWMSDPAGIIPAVMNPLVEITTNTTYYVTVSDGVNTATNYRFVPSLPLPLVYDVLGGGGYCEGSAGSYIHLSNSQSASFTYYLMLNEVTMDTKPGTGGAVHFDPVTQEGTYDVIASSPDGCWSQMNGTVEVFLHPALIADAGMNVSIPYNGTTTLNGSATGGSGTYSYLWSPAGLLDNPGVFNPTTLPLTETTNFYLAVTDLITGCQSSDYVEVTVSSTPLTADPSAYPIAICSGEEAALYANASGGTLLYTYTWKVGEEIVSTQGNFTVNPAVTTTYDLEVNDGLSIATGSVTVTVIPLPEVYLLSGGGDFCQGDEGVSVNINNTQNGFLYTLYFNGAFQSTFLSQGGPVSFLTDVPGIYTMSAADPILGCTVPMDGEVGVYMNDVPVIQSIVYGDPDCDQNGSIPVGLAMSETGVYYQLFFNGNPVGTGLFGTGSPITLANVEESGMYTVQANYYESVCDSWMAPEAGLYVTYYPLPLIYSVSGSTGICPGESAYIVLEGSEAGTYYELLYNGVFTGINNSGTGGEILFGPVTSGGIYTVVAFDPFNNCTVTMDNSATVQVFDPPMADAGDDRLVPYGTSVILFGSAYGDGGEDYAYHWEPAYLLVNADVQNPVTVNLTEPVLFTLVVTNNYSSCISEPDEAFVNITGGPISISVSATPATICASEEVQLEVLIENATASTTVSWTSDPEGFTSDIVNPVVNPGVTTTYYVEVADGEIILNEQVIVTVNPLPSAFTLSGSGNYCAGTEYTITLDGSQTGAIYTFYLDGEPFGTPVPGDGNPIVSTLMDFDGQFTAKAVLGDCEAWMNGQVDIVINPLPTIFTNPSSLLLPEGGSGNFHVISTLAFYQWQILEGSGWVDLTNNAPYNGAQTSTLSIDGVTLDMNGSYYRCLVTSQDNPNCSIYTASVSLTVYPVVTEITASLGNHLFCPGDIIVPIHVMNANNVASVSMTFFYNTDILTYQGDINPHPAIDGNGFHMSNTFNNKIIFSQVGLTPFSILDGDLISIMFSYTGGHSDLIWDLSVAESSEFTDFEGTTLSAVFVNGSIDQLTADPEIVTEPVNASVNDGGNAAFHITANGVTAYQWQVFDGESWTDLSDDALYSGTTSPDLMITGATLAMNGLQFRCIVSENVCDLSVTSNTVILTVNPVLVQIITSLGNPAGCPGTQVIVPVTVEQLYNVAAISLKLGWDPAVLTYVGITDLNPALNDVITEFAAGYWGFAWYNTETVNIASGTLLNLVFDYHGGYTDLTWYPTSTGACEYDDFYGNILDAIFVNGSVSSFPTATILDQPADASISDGGDATFMVTADDATAYAWFVSMNGGATWNPLSDMGVYSGTQTSLLYITGADISMNGNLYRCMVSSLYCEIFSSAAELTVLPVIQEVITTAGTVTACPGSQVIVPISGQYLYNIGAISLVLNFDPAVLTYVGYQNLNPVFTDVFSDITANSWRFSFFDILPINLSSGNLLELIFEYHGGNSDLNWSLVPGYCEYNDAGGNILPAQFVNGHVGPAGTLPVITGQPANVIISDMENTSFSVTASDATAYLWQESIDGGNNWNDLSDGGVYSGTSSSTLVLTGVPITMNYYRYRSVVTGDVCTVTSSSALLQVVPLGGIIQTVVPNLNACPGETIIVPVSVQYLYDISALSLTLNYDPAVLTYVNTLNPNAQLEADPGVILYYGIPGQWKLSWFSPIPISIGSGNLVDIEFIYHGGSTDLTWDLSVPGNCEYNDINGNVLLDNYTNGSVMPDGIIPVITGPVDMTITHGEDAQFSIVTIGATAYQWQVSIDNGASWMDLAEGGYYTGVTTANLYITGAIYLFNGYQYRCMVSGDVCGIPSNAATLTVLPVPFTVVTTAATFTACPGTDIVVPITVTDLYNVASMSLTLDYDDAILEYQGTQNLHPAMDTAYLSPTSGRFILSWFSVMPISLGDATLIELLFHYHGGTSDLTWDVTTPGYCEYTNLDGIVFSPVVFVDGQISSAEMMPVITSNPVPTGGFVGDPAVFTASAIDYTALQWQYSNDGGLNWFDVTDDGNISGATTEILTIAHLQLEMNGNIYRLMAYGTCGLYAASEGAGLEVILQATIITTAGTAEHCAGEVIIPVTAENFMNVADMSLVLNFNDAQYQYLGYQNTDIAFTNGTLTFTSVGGQITVGYSSLIPTTIADGVLFELIFSSTGGYTDLSWDVATPGNCEYRTIQQYVIPAAFVDGSITTHAIPEVTFDPLAAVCFNTTPFELSGGLPLNGVYSGEGVADGLFDPSVAGVGTWVITYTFTDEFGCVSSATQDITVYELPTYLADISANEICSGGSLTFTNHVTGAAPWTVEFLTNGVASTFIVTEDLSTYTQVFTETTVFQMVSVTDGNACTTLLDQVITVTVFDIPTYLAEISANEVCYGGSLTFTNHVTGTAPWTIEILTNGVASTFTVTEDLSTYTQVFTESTVFQLVSVTDGNACTALLDQVITVTVFELPTLVTTVVPTEICFGETVLFSNYFTGVAPWTVEFTYNGIPGSFTTSDNPEYYSTTFTETTVYDILTVTDGNACINNVGLNFTITVNQLTAITTSPANVLLDEGQVATFQVEAVYATDYQWQLSTDNGTTWTDLTDNIMYNGSNTAVLTVTGVTLDMSGYLYHAVASGICEPAATSEAAMLTVYPVITIIAGNVETCAGQFAVPVTATHFYGVASMSLTLNYDNTVLNFAGYQNENTEFNSGFMQVNAIGSQVKIGFFSITPANIGDGLLLELLFTSTGGYSDLTWDLVTPGNNELQDFDNYILTSLYVDGSVLVNPLPVITATVTGPNGSQTMTSGNSYAMSICSGAEVTTSDATSTSLNPAICGNLWLEMVYTTDISTLPPTQTFNAPVAPVLPPTSITPENHDGVAKDITFVSTPYYDVNGNGVLDAGDVAGLPVTFVLTVMPLPVVSIEPLAPLCVDAAAVVLVGTPSGGTFSGTGVVDGTFDPALAGVGVWTITYIYTDDNACTNSTTLDIIVNDLPTHFATISGNEVCYGGTLTFTNYFTGTAPWTVEFLENGVLSSFTTSENPEYYPQVFTVSTVFEMVSVTDANNCTSLLDQIISVIVYPLTSIVTSPADVAMDEGGNATFHVEALNATDYQWQISTDNGASWTDLVEDAVYMGVNTADLTVNGVSYFMNGHQFRCIVEGICPPPVTSAAATLTAYPVIITIAGDVEQCAGEILVPVSVIHLYGMAAMSLSLNFDNTVLEYTGFQDVNSEFSNGLLAIDTLNSQVKMGYFSIVPTNIGDGLMFNLKFHSNGGYSALTWDIFGLGNCEYHNLGGVEITSQYINGSVMIHPTPVITGTASPAVICYGESSDITFEITGTGPWTVTYTKQIGNGPVVEYTTVENFSPIAFTETPEATTTWIMTSVTDFYGCTGTDFEPLVLTVNELPGGAISLSDNEICFGETVTMTAIFTSGVAPYTLVFDHDGIIETYVTSENPWTMDIMPVANTTYTLLSLTDANGCTIAPNDILSIITHPLPLVTLDPVEPVCYDGAPVVLNGLPAGGVYAGTGVVDGVFYPAVAGVGTWTITYTYTDEFGCTSSASQDITVLPVTLVTLDPLSDVCIDADPVALNGLPVGGVYSGNGVVGNMFNPALAGAGTWTITYTFTNESGCVNFDTQDITVYALPEVTLAALAPVCVDASPVTLLGLPTGGIYSGTGVSGNLFDPALAGVGSWVITYTYTDENGCVNSASSTIDVDPLPLIVDVVGGGAYCAGGNGLVVALSGSQVGVEYHLFRDGIMTPQIIYGTGSPITFGNQTIAGIYTVYADYTATGCDNWMNGSATIVVNPVPNAYAGGYSIICQGVSTTLNAVVTGGTPPYQYQWTPAAGLDNPTILNPVASPSVTTFYTLHVTDINGCTDTDDALVVVNPKPNVNAGLDKTINPGASTTMTATVNGGLAPYTYSWTPASGLSNPTVLNPVASPLVTTTYTLLVTDTRGCTASDDVTINVTGIQSYDIYGFVNYFAGLPGNPYPLENTTVSLNLGGSPVATTVTGLNGEYMFNLVPNGNYTTTATSSKTWSGGNAIDALLIARHFQNLQTLSGLRYLAGDCDANGVLNANDALLVMMRSVVMINQYPAVPDWIFETKNITVNNGSVVNDFYGLCYGDVNGSRSSLVIRNSPNVMCSVQGTKAVSSYSEFTLPIQAGRNMQLGASSLVLDIPAGLDVTNVVANKAYEGSALVYNIVDGKLYIEWYTLSNVELKAGETLFTMTVRTNKFAHSNEFVFDVSGESEMGDTDANVIENAQITIPKVKIVEAAFNLGDNYPNPFSHSTDISYVLPESGNVSLVVYNAIGEVIAELVSDVQAAGTYLVNFDGSKLPQGIYFYRMTVNGSGRNYEAVRRMVISR